MAQNILSVLTGKSVATILRAGGTQSWVLDRWRAKGCTYAVLCRNAYSEDVEAGEAHHTAFMVGKIKDVVPSTESEGRWLVLFSEYALCDAAEQWRGRNPVAYWTTDQYDKRDIDFARLRFQPMPEPTAKATSSPAPGLTLADAKAGLALTFGVPPSAIEITIRA